MDGNSIRERLDCSLANNSWFMKFPGSIVNHHRCNSSNHCPLLINLSEFEPPPPKLPYRFEEMWLSNERCAETVESSWSSSQHRTSDNSILKRVETCGKNLAWWNWNIFGNARKELDKKRSLIIQAKSAAVENGQNHRVRELKEQINILINREAWMWSQQSRVLLLKHGDNNTKFFHFQASKRHRRNLIRGIKDESDARQVQSEAIASVLIRYY